MIGVSVLKVVSCCLVIRKARTRRGQIVLLLVPPIYPPHSAVIRRDGKEKEKGESENEERKPQHNLWNIIHERKKNTTLKLHRIIIVCTTSFMAKVNKSGQPSSFKLQPRLTFFFPFLLFT